MRADQCERTAKKNGGRGQWSAEGKEKEREERGRKGGREEGEEEEDEVADD